MTETITTIGSGNIGGTVARLAIAAGYDVVLSNRRGPETLSDLVAELGPKARAATPAQAATAGDLVIVSVPLGAYAHMPEELLVGKTVIDTGNYYPERDGNIAGLEDESTTTAELLQARLPQSHVVKAFNNIFFEHLATLARPHADDERSALPIAGDNEDAKQEVSAFLDAIGYDALDAGALAEGWRFQRDTPAYTEPYFASGPFVDGVYVGGPGQQVTADTLAEKIRQAKRYRDM